jgi:Ca-activated chloride channel family protein
MPELAEFHFLRPGWLLALLFLPFLPVLLVAGRYGSFDWQRHCDPELLPHLLTRPSLTARKGVGILSVLGGLLAILALAGPTTERLPGPAYRNLSALVVVLDLSLAMDATDIKPTRIERARYKITDLLQRRREGQSALLVYGGDAFTVTPLTDDAATLIAQLGALTPAILPVQGQRSDLALDQAVRLLSQAGVRQGHILLVSAGGNNDPAGTDRVAAVSQAGYHLSVLGVGTPEGAPIPLTGGGFLRDDKGEILVTRLNAQTLANQARQGGGLYHKLTDDDQDIEALLQFFAANPEARVDQPAALAVDTWVDRGPWLLLPLLPLAALAFRRGWLGLWFLAGLVMPPDPAQALDWQNGWKTPYQQAREALARGQPEQAARLFENPDWKAAAAYQAHQYQDTVDLLKNQDDARSRYNLGNALARLGRYQEALQAYERSLQLTPGDEDVRYNRDLVKKTLEQQQSRPDTDNRQASGQNGSQNQTPPAEGQSPPGQEQQTGESAARSDTGEKADALPQKTVTEGPQNDQPAEAGGVKQAENRQASEQWLRRIPDDPGGLLKRKFYYQYQQRILEK